MIGDLGVLVNAIGLGVCFTILLVTANTMSMAVRERRTEIAVLKTLGFGGRQVMGLIVAEALLIGAAGGALGIGGAEWALWALNRAPGQTILGIAHLELRWAVAWSGVAVALGLGFAAGFFPALGAYRARVTGRAEEPVARADSARLQRPERPRALAGGAPGRLRHRAGGGRVRRADGDVTGVQGRAARHRPAGHAIVVSRGSNSEVTSRVDARGEERHPRPRAGRPADQAASRSPPGTGFR